MPKMKTKWSPIEIARKTGYRNVDVYRWLTGERAIKLKVAEDISNKTGLPVKIFTSPKIQEIYFKRVFLKEGI